MSLKNELEALEKQAQELFKVSMGIQQLYEAKVQFLGKQGSISQLMKGLGKADPKDRPALGQLVNQVKKSLESAYQSRESELKAKELEAKILHEKIDVSLPGVQRELGALHPIERISREVVGILSRIGYSVRTGPQIEKDWYNFEALNIPEDHPSRDLQDTFYIDKQHVLRTHTSPIQIRTMEEVKPPLRILAPGSVFRCDSDISHSPNFHQIEGLYVDQKVSMAELKGTISFFMKELFGTQMKVRFRPSFFPFTEPSAEFDVSCPICKSKGCRMCKNSGWIEIGGCGLVNPKVLKNVGLDPEEWQGFAFGFGLERMAIIRYGIEDIRLFYGNDNRFLENFLA